MEETTSVMNRLSGLQPIDPEDAAARQSLVNDTIAVAAGWTKRADDVYKTKFCDAMAQGFATIVLGMVGQPDRDSLEVIDDGMNMVKHSFEQLVSESPST